MGVRLKYYPAQLIVTSSFARHELSTGRNWE